jgi:imidazolonepropionase-like amidohydrolase
MRSRRILEFTITLSLGLLGGLVLEPAAQAQQRISIQGVTLIDGTEAAPARNVDVLIEGPKIKSIFPHGSSPTAAGARMIDAAGKFVVPGLMDAHTHWRGWTGELFLAHGVTTVIDMGNATDWILAARGAEESGRMKSPRIFTSGNVIDAPPDRPTSFTDASNSSFHMSYVRNPAQARQAARDLMEKGVDMLKVYQALTGEELAAVTAEAHRVNIPVIGHSNNLYDSVNNGIDGVTHLWGVGLTLMSKENLALFQQGRINSPYAWMDSDEMDRLVAFLVQHGTYINPCLINEHMGVMPQSREFELADYQLLMNPNLRYIPLGNILASLTFFHKLRNYSGRLGSFPYVESVEPAVLEEFRRGYKNSQEFVRRFAKAGGKIFTGTDASGSASLPGTSVLQELQLLVEAGLTPQQAIRTATALPAAMIHIDYKLGTLQPGKLADLVVLDADPIADIRNIQKINMVVKDGKVVDTSYHRDYDPAFMELEAVGVTSSTTAVPRLTELLTITPNQWSAVIHNGSPFEMVVKGQGLHSTSLVLLNGRPLKTQFVNSRELHAQVPTERILAAGTFPVTVTTPWPGGGVSNVLMLTVK